MKVFITGATGFIGSAVAGAFARAGHHVHGLARSSEKAASLAAMEVVPVLGTMEEPGSWLETAKACPVSIHCAVDGSERSWDLHRQTLEILIEVARSAGTPRTVVGTSGVWVYGSTGDEAVDETSSLSPPGFVAPRPAVDERLLAADGGRCRTLLVRPGCVYGGSGSLTAAWFRTAVEEGAARVVGDGSNRWAMIHRDDLAELYLRAVESPVRGELFNATDRSRSSVLECARAASRAAGREGAVRTFAVEDAVNAMGPYAACLALDQHVDSSKAVRLLGWQPRHGGFADGAARYFAAWKASRKG